MVKNLSCRIKAYAKLSVNKEVEILGEDFLKEVVTTPKDTLIDLEYKDVATNREVYAVRRIFNLDKPSGVEFNIKLASCVGRVLNSFGYVYSDNYGFPFPNSTVNKNVRIENNVFEFTAETSGTHEYTYDIYIVFTGTKEYLTQEDIGNVTIEGKKFDLTTYGYAEFVVYDETGSRVVSGDRVLEGGKQYTVQSVTAFPGYVLNGTLFNGNYITIPYTFVCREDVSLAAETEEEVIWRSLSTNSENCVISVYDWNGTPVYSGEYALKDGGRYYLNVYPVSDFNITSITFNGTQIDHSNLPYDFTVSSDVSIDAVATAVDRTVTLRVLEDRDENDPVSGIVASIDGQEYISDRDGYIRISSENVPSTLPFTIMLSDPRQSSDEYNYYYSFFLSPQVSVSYLPYSTDIEVHKELKPFTDVYIEVYASDPREQPHRPTVTITDAVTGRTYVDGDRIPANRECTLSTTYNTDDWELINATFNDTGITNRLPYWFITSSDSESVFIQFYFNFIGGK